MFEEYKKYEPIFGSWYIKRLIGEGSYGKVFEIEREDFGTYKAALKVVSIPQSGAEIEAARGEGMDEEGLKTYYRSLVDEIVKEFVLMSQLKGTANVVSYEDHLVIPHEDGIGYDVLIRMELLTSLKNYLADHLMTERDVIKMGLDISRALELCQKHNIIHRDIKPENIFISPNGDYKLGDFGIARTVESTMDGLSKKGTFFYMAPEVYRGYAYGGGVDIYSLGMVMYFFLNNKRHPFMPPSPQPIKFSDREAALANLMRGKPIPRPVHGSDELWTIVQKACEFLPENRFSSPAQMRERLEALYLTDVSAEDRIVSGSEIAQTKMGQYVFDDTDSDSDPMPDGPGTAMLDFIDGFGDSDEPTVIAGTTTQRKAAESAKKAPRPEPTVKSTPAPRPSQRKTVKKSGTAGKIAAGSIFGAVVIIFVIFMIVTLAGGNNKEPVPANDATEITDQTEQEPQETEDEEPQEPEEIELTDIELNASTLTMTVGDTTALTVSPYPDGAQLGTVEWSSSDTDVVTVDSYGGITAVGAGMAGVTAECDGHRATCTVTVTAPVTVTGISIATLPSKTEYQVGESLSTDGLSITINYSDGTTQTKSDGFTVNSDPFTQAGTYSITITYADHQASFNVAVRPSAPEIPDEPQNPEEPDEGE